MHIIYLLSRRVEKKIERGKNEGKGWEKPSREKVHIHVHTISYKYLTNTYGHQIRHYGNLKKRSSEDVRTISPFSTLLFSYTSSPRHPSSFSLSLFKLITLPTILATSGYLSAMHFTCCKNTPSISRGRICV